MIPDTTQPLDTNPEIEARMLVAQAWCTKENAHKVMDPDLANAAAEIFAPYIKRLRLLSGQIDELANFIMREIPGEPSQSQGAVDTAIRLLRSPRPSPADPGDLAQAAQAVVDAASTGSTFSEYSQQHNTTMSLVPTKLLRALEKALAVPVSPAEGGRDAAR